MPLEFCCDPFALLDDEVADEGDLVSFIVLGCGFIDSESNCEVIFPDDPPSLITFFSKLTTLGGGFKRSVLFGRENELMRPDFGAFTDGLTASLFLLKQIRR